MTTRQREIRRTRRLFAAPLPSERYRRMNERRRERRQRQAGQHLRLLGHAYAEAHYGDGYQTPREAYGLCSCGVYLWEANQAFGAGYREMLGFREHLADVRRTRRPLIHRGRAARH